MKTNPIIQLFFVFLSVSFSANAQYVLGFRVQQSGNSVILQFSVTSGNTCNGIDILRSTDSVSFEIAGNIPGVCGSTTDDVLYTYTDENPQLNRDNYYKLDLKQLGYSSVIRIHVYDLSNKLAVFPNPAHSDVSVYFSPAYGRKATLEIYHSNGKKIFEKQVKENLLQVNLEFLETGVYPIRIVTEDGSRLSNYLIRE